MHFRDRTEAGRRLAGALDHLAGRDPVVLALPRGGVPVAAPVAAHLGAPLDVVVVRKIGLPRQPELGVGAVGEDGTLVFNLGLLGELRLRPHDLTEQAEAEAVEVQRRLARYRGDRPAVDVAGRVVVVVDDGLATGFTARAAVQVLRQRGAEHVVVAVPVASLEAAEDLRRVADELVCLARPSPFRAIGMHYDDFHQLDDAEVVAALDAASAPPA